MSGIVKRTLLVFAMIFLIFLSYYAVNPSQIARNPMAPARDYRYSTANSAKVSTSEAQNVLLALTQSMNPNDLASLRQKLHGLLPVPVSGDDPLQEYIWTLGNFTDKLNETHDKLSVARMLVASGQMDKAASEVRQLDNLRGTTSRLMKSLYSLLDLVGGYYAIDTTNQLQKLDELNSIFQAYSEQIDQLASKFRPQQGLFQTFLSLNASAGRIFVNETFAVSGSLKDQNGTALANRNITISWGFNQSISRMADYLGRFEAELVFPIGFPEGQTYIRANFEPEGTDKILYSPAASVLLVQVTYKRSIMTVGASPPIAQPLDYVYIIGILSSEDTKPLENRTVTMQLDGVLLGDTTTDKNGTFMFRIVVAEEASNGTHTVTASFDPRNDLYLPSNATATFSVQLQETEIAFSSNPSSLFSGMKLTVNGTVNYVNNTNHNVTALPAGEVTLYLDNIKYSTATLGDNGSFIFEIQLPLGLSFGSHSILIEYAPDIPWIQSSQVTREVFVYSIPLTFVAIAATVTVPIVVTYLVRRNRLMALRSAGIRTQQVVPMQPGVDEFSPYALKSKIDAEPDYHRKVTTVYSLAQAMIMQRLGEAPRESETPYEYFLRITKIAPRLRELLEPLRELYQLAEYSPYPVGQDQGKDALEILLKLRKEIETVK